MDKTSKKEPKYLYHGSRFDTDGAPLRPGFWHTGELISWDGGLETNEFLYATTDAKEALLLGIGSFIEKEYEADRYGYDLTSAKNCIYVVGAKQDVSVKDLLGKKMYLYTIIFKRKDGWYKNENPYNNIDTEWKTTHHIKASHFIVSEIDIGEWLTKNRYKIINERK